MSLNLVDQRCFASSCRPHLHDTASRAAMHAAMHARGRCHRHNLTPSPRATTMAKISQMSPYATTTVSSPRFPRHNPRLQPPRVFPDLPAVTLLVRLVLAPSNWCFRSRRNLWRNYFLPGWKHTFKEDSYKTKTPLKHSKDRFVWKK